jgi:aspartyl-tRNA(Asn)/glutamyl-tRNA(Gln) amidotransferase subunit A
MSAVTPDESAIARLKAALAAGDSTVGALVAHAQETTDEWACVESLVPVAEGDGSADEGPLAGLPLGVKANLDIAGCVTTAGSGVRGGTATTDAAAVAALRAAGAIPALITTMAEAAIGSVTNNPWTGVCVSPADPSRNAGGSSGGSAAAVAAGLVPFALGSDTMGSVRIPAACCGVVGWKPSRGLLPTDGLVPLSSLLDTVGVLAASAADVRTIASVLNPSLASAPASASRIAKLDLPVATDAAAQEAVTATLEHLTRAGFVAAPQESLEIDAALVRRRGLLLCEVEAAVAWADALASSDPGLSERTAALLRYGQQADDEAIERARAAMRDVESAALALFEDVDLLVLPTLPGVPPLLDEDPPGLADLTAWVNAAGLPAVSVPTDVVAEGELIPRSIQLVGRPGDDARVLAAAVALQAAQQD